MATGLTARMLFFFFRRQRSGEFYWLWSRAWTETSGKQTSGTNLLSEFRCGWRLTAVVDRLEGGQRKMRTGMRFLEVTGRKQSN